MKVKLRHKGSRLPLRNQNRKRYCFPQSLSPGNSGTTGITVETLHRKEKVRCWWRKQRRRKGRVIDTAEKQEAADGHSLDGEHSGVASKAVPLLICVSPNTTTWDSSKPAVLCVLINKTSLLINTTRCVTLPFHSTDIRVSWSNRFLLWTVAWLLAFDAITHWLDLYVFFSFPKLYWLLYWHPAIKIIHLYNLNKSKVYLKYSLLISREPY